MFKGTPVLYCTEEYLFGLCFGGLESPRAQHEIWKRKQPIFRDEKMSGLQLRNLVKVTIIGDISYTDIMESLNHGSLIECPCSLNSNPRVAQAEHECCLGASKFILSLQLCCVRHDHRVPVHHHLIRAGLSLQRMRPPAGRC